jgi:hypothetical protein
VQSSNLTAVGHDPERRVAAVRFKNGSEYEYPDVEEDDVSALLKATSVGQHFNQVFKSKYKGEPVAKAAVSAPKPGPKKMVAPAQEPKTEMVRAIEEEVLMLARTWYRTGHASDLGRLRDSVADLVGADPKPYPS